MAANQQFLILHLCNFCYVHTAICMQNLQGNEQNLVNFTELFIGYPYLCKTLHFALCSGSSYFVLFQDRPTCTCTSQN